MKNNKTKQVVLAGLMIALAQILSYIKVLEMPYGGSVTAGSMVPIVLYALVFGPKYGILVGTVYGVLQFILDGGVAIHPLGLILDYLVAFGALGLAGFFAREDERLGPALAGTFLAGLGRFLTLFISGVVVWGAYAPEDMGMWKYSFVYNITYMAPETILSMVIVGLIYSRFKRAIRRG